MSFNRMLAYACLLLISLCLISLCVGCSCIHEDYKTGACGLYEKVNGTTELVSNKWFSEPCGCDDLYETFRRQEPLDSNYCVRCNHPYDLCEPFNTCD